MVFYYNGNIGEVNNDILADDLLHDIEDTGNELNKIKSELRNKEFDLKVLKSQMEFSDEYSEFREGLKVKEVAPKILEATLKESKEICALKEKRDELEHKLYVLKLKFHLVTDLISNP